MCIKGSASEWGGAEKYWEQGKHNAKKHALSHPVIIFRCIQMLMQLETKHCIYFCIDSSLFQNLLRHRNGQGRGSSAAWGWRSWQPPEQSFPSVSLLPWEFWDQIPFGWIPCLLQGNSLRKTLPRYNYYHIWSSNGFYRNQYKIFLCLALPIFTYKSVHVNVSISLLTNNREGKKKRKKREWRWQHLLFLYKFLLETLSSM